MDLVPAADRGRDAVAGVPMPMKSLHFEHRLNQPCPDCGDPMWLHTDRCLKLSAAGRFTVTRCGCPRTAKDFAAPEVVGSGA